MEYKPLAPDARPSAQAVGQGMGGSGWGAGEGGVVDAGRELLWHRLLHLTWAQKTDVQASTGDAYVGGTRRSTKRRRTRMSCEFRVNKMSSIPECRP